MIITLFGLRASDPRTLEFAKGHQAEVAKGLVCVLGTFGVPFVGVAFLALPWKRVRFTASVYGNMVAPNPPHPPPTPPKFSPEHI